MPHISSIGILIHYYRTKNKITITDIIHDIDNTSICSKKTYSMIEKGIINRIDPLDLLCRKINKSFYIDINLLEKLNHVNDTLYDALCEMSIFKMNNVYKYLNSINIEKNHIYFYECYSLYIDILNYYLLNIIPKLENVDIYKEMLKSNNFKMNRLILHFLYTISNINTMNIDRKEIIILCDQHLNDPLFFNRRLTSILSSNSLIDTYIIYNDILKNENLNKYQNTYLHYMISLNLLNANHSNKAYECLKTVIDNHLIEYFPISIVINFYTALAICAHSISEYKIAVEYFDKVFELNYSYINYNFLVYFDSLEKLNDIDKLISLCDSIKIFNIQNELVKNIFSYYRLKYQNNINNKVKYSLMEKILSDDLIKIAKFGDGYSKILTNELMFMCNQTKNYKLLQLVIPK